ncbi:MULTISPECIES: DUF4258 domain-containing protein [Yersinia]|uniref:DUF4258 domain-containing protein n=2 Tax=Yersinia bercovieri TaxID=634 RepID=A0A2G4U5F1_YERBE|nr:MULTISPECIES: DUF4258 domain-containing protein [Yersinia]EEQ06147.1 hypothetical protein yberc0001_26240 [Yersinia bercovieri ATCC 43970]MCB5303250.1 DUF4258 domain-containing protein [Yersinia bercovieri]MDN0102208.1 DUF4258 domain-containing protein [Yersinia bercovieri]PHZ28538.1 DUF4258 domain-containing protein [Yersinia bercovieri]QDW32940.1 DUF4258 domain-containing protein [Yersinia sp. KBS0713]
MESNTPLCYQGMAISEFPLSPISVRKIVNDLATNHTSRIRMSTHAKQRIAERRITLRQILSVFASKHSRFTEAPHQTAAGDWKFNLQGIAAGDVIEVVTVLKRHENDPTLFVITVMIK